MHDTPPSPRFDWQRWLPGLSTLLHYQPAWLPKDIAAGLVLTTMLVPVGIAYAEASGVPGIYGLYATIIPCWLTPCSAPAAFWCLARTRHWPRRSWQWSCSTPPATRSAPSPSPA